MILSPPGRDKGKRAWQSPLLLGVVLALLVIAVYGNSWSAPFVFDDRPAIVDNPTIRNFWGSWRTPENGSSATGRPLVNMTFALNYAAGGLSVRGYHAVNSALHVASVLVLFGLTRRTLRRGWPLQKSSNFEAWAIAAWWGVHPLLTESVTCAVQRNELMAGGFYLLTLYAFGRAEDATTRPFFWRVLSFCACLAGVLTKEVVATAPLMVLLYDRTFVTGTFRAAWARHRGFYLALAATWLPLALLIGTNRQRTGTVGFGLGVSSWEYLFTQCRALPLYLKLSVWPNPLVVDYGVPVIRDWHEVAWRGFAVVMSLGATIWALAKKPTWGFLAAWVFVILAPSSSVIPLTTQTIAEHRMYLPLIAIAVGVIVSLKTFSARWFSLTITSMIALLSAVTIARNQDYGDEFRLWQQTIAAEPANPRGYSNLGNAHARKNNWPEAIVAYRQALEIRPDFADAQSNLGNVLLEFGQRTAAIGPLYLAVELKPEDPDIRYNLGNGLYLNGKFPEAREELQKALLLRKTFPTADYKLGLTELSAGRPADAARAFQRALTDRPDYIEALSSLGNAQLELGEAKDAILSYRRALGLAPKVSGLHYNLANAYLRQEQWSEAVAEYRAALNLDPGSVASRHNLALALIATGKKKEALEEAREAERLAPTNEVVVALVRKLERAP